MDFNGFDFGKNKGGATKKSKALHVGLDLGGDTLKISFAHQNGSEVGYGKIAGETDTLQIALPAVAYYDIGEGKWYFADAIERKKPEEYITIVKIKNLIAMLSQPALPTEQESKFRSNTSAETKKKAIEKEWERRKAFWKKNESYYFKENLFPKFYFPAKRELLQEFEEMVKKDMTFTAPGFTPKAVCLEFFRYVRALVDLRKAQLEKAMKCEFEGYRISLVHPAGVGDDYLDELGSLVSDAFGTKPFKVLNSNKALALYAMQRGAVREGESFLVFDMGEESISVVQATIVHGQVMIDGVEGHSAPEAIGGNDIDEAIVHHLEMRVHDRNTPGTPPAGQEGHIYEQSAYGKQYLLMKDVKKAKTIFSKPRKANDLFANGVTVTLHREVRVQCALTREDVEKSIGITSKTGIAKKIAAYILEEIKHPINRKVKKIFVSGGVTETCGLLDFIKRYLQKEKCTVEVCTFEDGVTAGDEFSILAHEDSVFAASVGGAIVALLDIDVKTVFSLSYATWVNDEPGKKHLYIFANRGDPIGANGTEKYSDHFGVINNGVDGEEIFSVLWTREDMEKEAAKAGSKYTFSYASRLEIGEPGSAMRRLAQDMNGPGLKLVSGGNGGKIRLRYRGEYVHVGTTKLQIEEGIRLDKYGRATPDVRNCKVHNKGSAQVILLGANSEARTGRPMTVQLTEIEPKLEGLDDFSTSIS